MTVKPTRVANTESMIVLCAMCGTPGKAVIDTDKDEIVERYFVCKCPRPPLPTKAHGDRAREQEAPPEPFRSATRTLVWTSSTGEIHIPAQALTPVEAVAMAEALVAHACYAHEQGADMPPHVDGKSPEAKRETSESEPKPFRYRALYPGLVFRVRDGELRLGQTVRVHAVEVAFDRDGNETYTVDLERAHEQEAR